ncbi:MAG: amidohydrolase family protein [Candidatus Entotheonellia bacterium]
MPGELIIDTHAHVYRTAEIGRQAMENFAHPQRWGGLIEELRAIMRETGIWRTVIATVTPTQAMREKALSQLPPDLSREARERAETEVYDRLLQRMDHNNLWGCEVGRTYPELLPFINLDPVLMDAVTIRQKVREAVVNGARGIVLLPGLHGFYGNDRRVWPIYEMAQSFQLPILTQTGDAGSLPPGGRGHWGRPRYFGDVAVSFPKLRLILGHLGKGYESEIAVLTRRYPNVYTETSMRLSGLDEAGKWTPAEAVTWFRLIGIDRILLGTKWPLFDSQQDIGTVRKLPLTPEERRKILGENAKRVLQL